MIELENKAYNLLEKNTGALSGIPWEVASKQLSEDEQKEYARLQDSAQLLARSGLSQYLQSLAYPLTNANMTDVQKLALNRIMEQVEYIYAGTTSGLNSVDIDIVDEMIGRERENYDDERQSILAGRLEAVDNRLVDTRAGRLFACQTVGTYSKQRL